MSSCVQTSLYSAAALLAPVGLAEAIYRDVGLVQRHNSVAHLLTNLIIQFRRALPPKLRLEPLLLGTLESNASPARALTLDPSATSFCD